MADRLSTSFILGFHGCDKAVADKLVQGASFRESNNDYDWLGPGIYFWEKNPRRALHYAEELASLTRSSVKTPAAVGAVIDLGLCLDLTTKASIDQVGEAHQSLVKTVDAVGGPMPTNNEDGLRRNLDCAVMRMLHHIRDQGGDAPVDTVKGIFIEGEPIYETAGFYEKSHVQICVRNPDCIKGVFKIR